MDKEEKLKKINKEIKSYINEAAFISIKLRNKLIKMLGEEFSITLPVENFKNLDVTITKTGNIIMRDEEYKRSDILSFEELVEKYEAFSLKAKDLIDRKEINYYNINDKNNIINVLILIAYIVLFVVTLFLAKGFFMVGDYSPIVLLIGLVVIFFVPGFRDRLEQAINYIKRKFKK